MYTGMKAEDIAPSPTISRSMLGIRNATKKASDRSPRPQRHRDGLVPDIPVTRESSVSGA